MTDKSQHTTTVTSYLKSDNSLEESKNKNADTVAGSTPADEIKADAGASYNVAEDESQFDEVEEADFDCAEDEYIDEFDDPVPSRSIKTAKRKATDGALNRLRNGQKTRQVISNIRKGPSRVKQQKGK